MTIWILGLDLAAALTQLIGFTLLIAKGLHARRMLRSGTWAVIDGGTPGGRTHHEYTLLSVVELVLRDAAGTWWAFGLIALGIVAGATSSIVQFLAS
ncbi:hypothetical protein [uncultured Microbacterium sp.]|uniref:hypothetical protein n=1 Tax=uncultured Microbacterium sp. TaxID=191216 RepID=UPI0028D3E575|nr:hypothetical protein [uncultured Microbacterium sp.]